MKYKITFVYIFFIISNSVFSQDIIVGAEQLENYHTLIDGKRIGLLVNQTSYVKNTHLVDFLIEKGYNIQLIFAPEHGFKGSADAGEHISNGVYGKNKIPIVSLYGENKKPTSEHMKKIDILLFDIQDVGARFYTYISTMHYAMEACAENNVKFIILDRPNPMGMYVDGPVLDLKFQSFVGMHPIPIIHGLTVGELAKMINGEHWLNNNLECDLTIISCKNYTHQTKYSLPYKPSPNLPNDLSVYLYPSLCLFEGTAISIGRGTYEPFQQIGYPNFTKTSYSFIPKSIDGMSKYPKFENKKCYGYKLSEDSLTHPFSLKYLIEFYNFYSDKKEFFNVSFFDKLAGTDKLRLQIVEGVDEEKIRRSWKEDLEKYYILRNKYIMYYK